MSAARAALLAAEQQTGLTRPGSESIRRHSARANELAPTADELRAWHAEAGRVVAALGGDTP